MKQRSASSRGNASVRHLPAVDERLVAPGARYEILDGVVRYVPPSDEPHGSRHSKVAALLEAHVATGYDVAADMLTRAGRRSDCAPDASIFPAERDPGTGGRRIEELAFEVVSTERLSEAAKKARELAGRGVRRIFAIEVARKRAFAWSRETDTWEMLDGKGTIEHPALAVPLPLAALVHAAKVDDAVASALLEKRNPVLEAALSTRERRGHARGKREGRKEGRKEGAIALLLELLADSGIMVPPEAKGRIRATTSLETLHAWALRVRTASQIDDVLGPESPHPAEATAPDATLDAFVTGGPDIDHGPGAPASRRGDHRRRTAGRMLESRA